MRLVPAALLIFGLILLPSSAAAEPLRVGILLPLSGDGVSIGNYIRNGLELARTQRPTGEKELVEFVYQDDRMQPSVSVTAFRKLVAVDGVKVVIGLGSAIGNALAPLAEQEKVLLIAIGASDKKVAEGRQLAFTHWVSPEAEAEALASEVQRRGLRRLALLGQEQEGILAIAEAFERAIKDTSANVVLREFYAMDGRDFRSYITKARAKRPDAVFVLLHPGALSSFAKQARSHGLKAELFGAEMFEDPAEVAAAGGALTNAWFVNADMGTQSFQEQYFKAYGEVPGIGSANGYDVANLLFGARLEDKSTAEDLAAYLRAVRDYAGAAGRYSATGDNRFTLPAVVKVVTNEGFRKVALQ